MRKARGIVLYSGGLDSLIAAKLLMEAGAEVTAVNFVLPFVSPKADLSKSRAAFFASQIGLEVEFHRLGTDYIRMTMDPPNGYGKFMNPCIDCKIFFIKEAAEIMHQLGLDFVATGEVVGQRPMSQMRNNMNRIQKASGLEDRLLRPLSAKLLKPTLPETEGLINREFLLDINGRGRGRQMELARKYGIKEYASPAGGCCFAERYIAARIKDLYHNSTDEITAADMYLLTIGRHLQIPDGIKFIVSRNEEESIALSDFRDGYIYMSPDFRGPSGLLKPPASQEQIRLAASIIAAYGKPDENESSVEIYEGGRLTEVIPVDRPADREKIKGMLL